MSTSTEKFDAAVQSVVARFEPSGVIDRFAANDVLLDLLEAAATEDEASRVMGALASLPKSNLVDRAELARLLSGLTGQN